MGDVLCCTPTIRALRRAFPRAYIAALVVRYSQDAITGNPDLDEVFIYEKAKHRPDQNRIISLYKQFRVERELSKKRFDLAIGLRSTFSWSEAWLKGEGELAEKVIGILGGMGPEATLDRFEKIKRNTPAGKDQDHLRIIGSHLGDFCRRRYSGNGAIRI